MNNSSCEFSSLRRLGLAVLLFIAASSAWGQASVTGMNQASSTRVGRTTYDYTYTINVNNGSPGLSGAIATVTSSAAATIIVQGSVSLGILAAGASTTSTNTFTLQQDRLVPFNPAALSWTITGTPFDVVPSVVNLTQTAASAAITGAGLTVGTVSTVSSSSVASGSVIGQNPSAGASATPGSAVILTVSSGPASVTVPSVVNLTQAAASSAITGVGLIVGTVSTASSSTVASGSVISQTPSGGASAASGSAVNLTVSTGPVLVSVPTVTGLSQAAASAAISGAGLVVGAVTSQSSSTVPTGEVISEGPPAGTLVDVGSAVSFVVSTGPAQVTVPNVVGLSQASATSMITGDSLALGTVSAASSATVVAGNVISESPSAGTSVSPGSTVSLIVSTGPPTVAVPNVVSLTQASAATAVVGAGLVVGTVTSQSSTSVSVGVVISESPLAGTLVVDGSSVNLVISTGPSAYQGTLLPGNPSGLAVSATTTLGPTQSSAAAITSTGVLLDTIDMYFDPAATVGQINAAIESVNGSISGMVTGESALALQIPTAPDAATLSQIAQTLSQQSGVIAAYAGVMPTLLSVPQPYAGTENTQHLAAARFPAAFSVLSNPSLNLLTQCSGPSLINVIVADVFDFDPNVPDSQSSRVDFAARVPSFKLAQFYDENGEPLPNIIATNKNANNEPYHGADITMTLAGTWSAGGVAGTGLIGAAPTCVQVHGINIVGRSMLEDAFAIAVVAHDLIDQTGQSVVLSASFGYQNSCGGTDNNPLPCSSVPAGQIGTPWYIERPAERAVEALTWRGYNSIPVTATPSQSYWQRILSVVGAGNAATTPAAVLYPGAGLATADSFLSLAGSATPLSTLIQNTSLWNPTNFLGLGYPNLVATSCSVTTIPPCELQIVQTLEANLGSNVSQYGSTIVTGALQPFVPPPGTLTPKLDQWLATVTPWSFSSAFSTDYGVYAVGVGVAGSCPVAEDEQNDSYAPNQCAIDTGTSITAPQVSGLATMLWAVDGALISPLHQGNAATLLSSTQASNTVFLISSTARPLPAVASPNNQAIDALAAMLSLDMPQAVTPTTAPVRQLLLDQDGNGTFDQNDVLIFIRNYYKDPTRFEAFQPMPGSAPDFSVSDLNGDGYTGAWTTTTFDLDPTGSTQYGAPLLNVVSKQILDGHTLHFDENAVTDLDVMCYYAYSDLFTGTDTNGSIRAGLGCDAVVIMAESGDTLSGGSDGTTLTQTIESIDSKVSVNKSGAIAFSISNTNNSGAGARVDAAHSPYPISFGPSTTRSYGGASLNDAPAGPQAAFEDRFSGAPPSYFVRRWQADGTAVETDIGTSPSGAFASALSYVDMNDAGVVVFPSLDPTFSFEQLMAGTGGGLNTFASFADNAGTQLRPQIASNNLVVYANPSGDIVVTNALTNSTAPVAQPPAITAASDRPGISADGNWVAFGGTLVDLGPALFISSAISPGSSSPSFSGPVAVLFAGPGGDPTPGVNAQFNSFGVRPSVGSDGTRFGIATTPTSDGSGTNITVVFVASRSYLNSSQQVTKTVYGVYHLSAVATGSGNATTYTNIQVDPIVEVGDKLADGAGISRTVADFDLWDPVSKNGTYAGFWVQFLETLSSPSVPIQAAVRRHL